MKRLIIFCIVLIMCISCSASVFAAGTVRYEGQAEKFIFTPGSKYSPTDIFEHFCDVMPGDTCTQKILIKNDASNNVKINVYMRSLGAHKDSVDFLSQMTLDVKQDGNSNLFSAPADQKAQLSDWVLLGTVYSGGEITLDVTLNVPITMDNNFQEKIGYLDWQFKVDELSVSPDDPRPPKTGDNSHFRLYIILMLLSLSAIFLIGIYWRRKNKQSVDN